MSHKLNHSFVVDQLKDNYISILSVFNDKLLVSCDTFSQLFIYSREGRHLSTITTNGNDNLFDATWTPNGNIVYTSYWNHKVVTMSESGKVIATNNRMKRPQHLSVSKDNTIFLADTNSGVYHSTDNGITWNLVFKSNEKWQCHQVSKVVNGITDNFWTLLRNTDDGGCHLRVYKVDRRSSNGNTTWQNISLPSKNRSLHVYSRLLYDGNMYMFLSDYANSAVYMLPVEGEGHFQLLSSNEVFKPRKISFDRARQLFFVVENKNVVKVFKLNYNSGN